MFMQSSKSCVFIIYLEITNFIILDLRLKHLIMDLFAKSTEKFTEINKTTKYKTSDIEWRVDSKRDGGCSSLIGLPGECFTT